MFDDPSYYWIVVTGCVFSFVAAFGIGSNDVANAFASSVGSKALTVIQAVLIAAVFEFGGAVLLGSEVTDTVRKKIVDFDYFENNPDLLMIGMLSVIISVAAWLLIATHFELPVSTTHSCVGAIIGMAMATPGGVDAVNWQKVGLIVMSWFASPILSGIISASLFGSVRKFILRKDNSYNKTLQFFPVLVAFTVAVNVFFIIYKAGKGKGWNKFATSDEDAKEKNYNYGAGIGLSLAVGLVCGVLLWFVAIPAIRRTTKDLSDNPEPDIEMNTNKSKHSTVLPISEKLQERIHGTVSEDKSINDLHNNAEKFPQKTEGAFKYLQIFTAMFDAFSHGANDVSNSVGPLAAIVAIYNTNGEVSKKVDVPIWILSLGGAGIVVGLVTYGYKILRVLGVKLVKITPARGFAIELSSAFVIVVGSILGIPLSTTHCQTGATVGVGLLEGKNGINWKLFLKIIFGWVITLVVAGTTSATLFVFAVYSPTVYEPTCNATF